MEWYIYNVGSVFLVLSLLHDERVLGGSGIVALIIDVSLASHHLNSWQFQGVLIVHNHGGIDESTVAAQDDVVELEVHLHVHVISISLHFFLRNLQLSGCLFLLFLLSFLFLFFFSAEAMGLLSAEAVSDNSRRAAPSVL